MTPPNFVYNGGSDCAVYNYFNPLVTADYNNLKGRPTYLPSEIQNQGEVKDPDSRKVWNSFNYFGEGNQVDETDMLLY